MSVGHSMAPFRKRQPPQEKEEVLASRSPSWTGSEKRQRVYLSIERGQAPWGACFSQTPWRGRRLGGRRRAEVETEERDVGGDRAGLEQGGLEERAPRFDDHHRRDTQCNCVGKERYLIIIVRAVIDPQEPERIGWACIAERRMSTEAGNQDEKHHELEPRPSPAVTRFAERLSSDLIAVHLSLWRTGRIKDAAKLVPRLDHVNKNFYIPLAKLAAQGLALAVLRL